MSATIDQAKAKRERVISAAQEMAALYAHVANDPAGSRVLADIAGNLADPDFECPGMANRAEGFLARIRAAQRIDIMIRQGRAGK